jgi:hypothetical protein
MSGVATAIVGAAVVGAVASNQASKAQERSARKGEAGLNKRNEQLQELLKPYVDAGIPALAKQNAIAGLSGPEAQAQAIQEIEQGAGFNSMVKQGENAILQNASATGNLRGGNVNAALATFRPQMLSQAIESEYSRLAGLTALGENAAAGVGNAGMQTGVNVANLQQQQGAAQAGRYLAQGNALGNFASSIPGAVNAYNAAQPAQPAQPVLPAPF